MLLLWQQAILLHLKSLWALCLCGEESSVPRNGTRIFCSLQSQTDSVSGFHGAHWQGSEIILPIDLATMSYSGHSNQSSLIINLLNYAVWADSYSIKIFVLVELSDSLRTRVSISLSITGTIRRLISASRERNSLAAELRNSTLYIAAVSFFY